MSGRVTPKKARRCSFPGETPCPHRAVRQLGTCDCCGDPMLVCDAHYVEFLEAYAEGRVQLDGLVLELGDAP